MSELVKVASDALRQEIARPRYSTLDKVPGRSAANDALAGMALAVLTAIEKAGHRLVPVEPTPEMLAAVRWDDDDARAGWDCMLSAAPKVRA